MVLVVGATGQLGTTAVKKLLSAGHRVRALVRRPESVARFQALGADVAVGDLTELRTLQSACQGISTVVATANTAVPSRSHDTFEAVERYGYRNLVRASQEAGVKRFIYTSVIRSRREKSSTFFMLKRETERLVEQSGLEYVIFRADIFMDVSFVMLGSTLPVRGAEGATVLRPFSFTSRHLDRIRNSIERDRVAMIPGDGTTRHYFVCIDDVASFLAAAASGGPTCIYDVGGPEALTFRDVVRVYEAVLGFDLRIKQTPSWVFRIAAPIIRLFSPAGANIMDLNYMAATEDSPMDPMPAAKTFNVRLTPASEFLLAKSKLPAVKLAR